MLGFKGKKNLMHKSSKVQTGASIHRTSEAGSGKGWGWGYVNSKSTE